MPVSCESDSQPYQRHEFRSLGQTRLLLLAPPHVSVSPAFRNQQYDPLRHAELLAEMQRLRGAVYMEDGAIGRHELSADGRHRLEIDSDSWHLLAMDHAGTVTGCMRYRELDNSAGVHDLWIRHSALAASPFWGREFLSAVEAQICQARHRHVSYVEAGGWAIAPERRCTIQALRLVLATFGLGELLGGCIGITTATVKHCSSTILRRIGGSSLESPAGYLPPYYDPAFNCDMEVLWFDSARPTPKYLPMLNQLRREMSDIPVVCRSLPGLAWQAAGAQQNFGMYN